MENSPYSIWKEGFVQMSTKKPSSQIRRGLRMSKFSSPYLSDPDSNL
jgi:hypothetical protein